MSSLTIGPDPTERRRLGRRAQLLAATSVSYNLIKAVIAITAGTLAGSVALVGFGLDSVVEVSSGLVILWQFRHPLPESASGSRSESSQARSSPWPLCHGESVRALAGGAEPDASPLGIGLARVSLAVMPFLSWAQRRTGRQLGSNAVVADGTPYPAVHLPVGGAALRTDPQRHPGLVLGRPDRGARHRRSRVQGGYRSVARTGMLCPQPRTCGTRWHSARPQLRGSVSSTPHAP